QLVLSQQIDKITKEELGSPVSKDGRSVRKTRSSISQSEVSLSFNEEETRDEVEGEKLLKKLGAKPASSSQILKYAKPEMKFFVTGLLLATIRGFSWPIFAVLYGMLFKALSYPEESSSDKLLYIVLIGYITLGVLGGITTWLSGYIMGLVGEKLNVRLRMDVYKNLMGQDVSYYENPDHSVGKLTARLATDSNNVQAAVDQRLADVLKGVTSFFAGLVKKRALAETHLEDGISKITSESISNVKTIQSLTQEREICEKFYQASRNPLKKAIKRGWLMSSTLAIGAAFVSMSFAVSYMVGLLMIKFGYCSPFTVFQVIESLNVATMTVMAVVSYFPEYTRAKVSAGLIFNMLKEKPKIDNFSEGGLKPDINGNLELKEVDFSYPNGMHTLTLNKISMKANFGQTVAIVGASGCGKSTI
ncbi:hypothetical protein FO519_010151, partial [Halicephalobus sp. NKZ332]